MSNTQETVTVYVDEVAFEVDYQFDDMYLPSTEESGFDIVGLRSWNPLTDEILELYDWFKLEFCDFNEKLEQVTLQKADCEWLELSQH